MDVFDLLQNDILIIECREIISVFYFSYKLKAAKLLYLEKNLPIENMPLGPIPMRFFRAYRAKERICMKGYN